MTLAAAAGPASNSDPPQEPSQQGLRQMTIAVSLLPACSAYMMHITQIHDSISCVCPGKPAHVMRLLFFMAVSTGLAMCACT